MDYRSSYYIVGAGSELEEVLRRYQEIAQAFANHADNMVRKYGADCAQLPDAAPSTSNLVVGPMHFTNDTAPIGWTLNKETGYFEASGDIKADLERVTLPCMSSINSVQDSKELKTLLSSCRMFELNDVLFISLPSDYSGSIIDDIDEVSSQVLALFQDEASPEQTNYMETWIKAAKQWVRWIPQEVVNCAAFQISPEMHATLGRRMQTKFGPTVHGNLLYG